MNGYLIVSQYPDRLEIRGITAADPAVMELVGTVKEAQAIEIDDVSKLERSIVEAAKGGTTVMDGYIKFAKPILLKSPQQVKQAAAAPIPIEVDDGGFVEFIQKLSEAVSAGSKEDMEKLAAHKFGDMLSRALEEEKVSADELGIDVPVKFKFGSEAAKQLFTSMGKKAGVDKQGGQRAAAAQLADRLVAAGIKKAEAVEEIVRRMEKRKS